MAEIFWNIPYIGGVVVFILSYMAPMLRSWIDSEYVTTKDCGSYVLLLSDPYNKLTEKTPVKWIDAGTFLTSLFMALLVVLGLHIHDDFIMTVLLGCIIGESVLQVLYNLKLLLSLKMNSRGYSGKLYIHKRALLGNAIIEHSFWSAIIAIVYILYPFPLLLGLMIASLWVVIQLTIKMLKEPLIDDQPPNEEEKNSEAETN